MSIGRYLGDFQSAFDNVERMLDRALDRRFGSDVLGGTSLSDFTSIGQHPMDVVEKEDCYEITADSPGMGPGDIDVQIKNNKLSICGERKVEKREEEEGKLMKLERSQCTFKRSFVLPDNADGDKVAAKLDKGVLTVTVGKKEASETGGRKITVEGGSA